MCTHNEKYFSEFTCKIKPVNRTARLLNYRISVIRQIPEIFVRTKCIYFNWIKTVRNSLKKIWFCYWIKVNVEIQRKSIITHGPFIRWYTFDASVCKMFDGSDDSIFFIAFVVAFRDYSKIPIKCPVKPVRVKLIHKTNYQLSTHISISEYIRYKFTERTQSQISTISRG